MNASITALFACPPVRVHLSRLLQHSRHEPASSQAGCIDQALKALAGRATDPRSEDTLLGSSELRLAHTYSVASEEAHLGRPFVTWLMWRQFYNSLTDQQEDANQFLESLLDERYSPHLFDLFHGRLHPKIMCQGCPTIAPVRGFEDFVTLPIDISNQTSLQSAINDFLTRQESVRANEWMCPGCGKSRTYQKKQNFVTKSPEVLLVQLKRFTTSFDETSPGAAEVTYLKHRVECQEEILLDGQRYSLQAKVYHMGEGIHSGHYYTTYQHQLHQGRWWYFNDIERRLIRPADDHPPYARIYLCLYCKR